MSDDNLFISMPEPELIDYGLTGAEIIKYLRKGHLVRRACWVDEVFIRVVNVHAYDEEGNAVFDEYKDSLYTYGTHGYFIHFGYSSQPFKEPIAWESNGVWNAGQGGGGIGMLFADDWEAYNFMETEDFLVFARGDKDFVRDKIEIAKQTAIRKARGY